MQVQKKKRWTAAPRKHRYPTRHSLRAAANSLSSPETQVPEAGQIKKNHLLAPCRKSRKGETQTLSLPHDVTFQILLLLPVKFLYEVIRYVCWEWYTIVNDPAFISAHFQMSSSGILVQCPYKKQSAYYIKRNTARSNLEVTDFRIPIPGTILCSCNGLLLMFHRLKNPRIFLVVNPVTGEKMRLPPMRRGRPLGRIDTTLSCCTSKYGHYKVVHVVYCGTRLSVQVMICTVGVDKTWRPIHHDGILMNETVSDTFLGRAVMVAGFIYFTHAHHLSGFALDVDTEIMYQFPPPDGYHEKDVIGNIPPTQISMETSLGFLLYVWEKRCWELWKLVDVKCRKWTKFMVIEEATLCSQLNKMFMPLTLRVGYILMPFCSNKEELWIKIRSKEGVHVVFYNMRTGDILPCPDGVIFGNTPSFHLNSLVSLKS